MPKIITRGGMVLLLAALLACGQVRAPDASPPPASSAATALLLVDLPAAVATGQARPVDPISLADQVGAARYDFGRLSLRALSPDGRTLAAIIWPNGMGWGGQLQFFNLDDWSLQERGPTINALATGLSFSHDGAALYWMQPTRRDPAHGIPRDYLLYRYDRASRELVALVELPPTFIPQELRLLSSRQHLAIYGQPTNAMNLAESEPQVLIVDLVAGRLVTTVELSGLRAGQSALPNSEKQGPAFQLDRPGLAWDIARDRLYIAHADAERVTVVDLAAGKVLREATIAQRSGWLEQLSHWLIPTAAAKMVPGTSRQAVLSPDGTRLYTLGTRSTISMSADGGWTQRDISLGLQIIATADMRELSRVELPVSAIALAPDGRTLVLSGMPEAQIAGETATQQAHGLYLLDVAHPDAPVQLQAQSSFTLHGFSADSRYAYVSHIQPQQGTAESWRVMIQVLDLQTQRFVGERSVEHFGELLTLVP